MHILINVMPVTNERHYYYLFLGFIDSRHEVILKVLSLSKPQMVINQSFNHSNIINHSFF